MDLSLTCLQGDCRLAAAPLTPGALQVSDSDLAWVLSPMKETTLFHSSGWSYQVHKDLAQIMQRQLQIWTLQFSNAGSHFEWCELTGGSFHWLLPAALNRTSRLNPLWHIHSWCLDSFHLSFRHPNLLLFTSILSISGGSNLAEIKQSKQVKRRSKSDFS